MENFQSPLKKLFHIDPFSYRPQCLTQGSGSLYQKDTSTKIPLQSLSYDIEVIDSLAFVSLSQNYLNFSKKPIETEYFFSIADNACFYEFTATINGQTMIGQIKEKQEAKAEYEQQKAKGNTVAYSEVNKEIEDVIKVNIGNVPPDAPITIRFGYLQELEISLNRFWKLLIPSTLGSKFTPKEADAINIEEFNNMSFPQVAQGYEWSINVVLDSKTEVSFIRSPSHEIISSSLDSMNCRHKIQFKNPHEVPNKDFTLLFANQSLGKTRVSLAQIKEDDTPYCAMINFMPEFNSASNEDSYQAFLKNQVKNNYAVNMVHARGEFIFLLDRSGSMNGNRIAMATKALGNFVKKLPPDSYFNVIGFGSDFEKLYKESIRLDEEVLKEASRKVSEFKADLGGTVIYSPLKEAINTPKIQNYPKNIFILTDGDVGNTVEILGLIGRSNDLCRVYTIGVGNGCSREVIVEGAKLGKGKYEFIAEDEDMNDKIIGLLEDSITPFLSEFHMIYDKTLINIVAPLPDSIHYIRKNEELKIFAFLNGKFGETKKTNVMLEFYDSTTKNKHFQTFDLILNDETIPKDYLHKYGAFEVIKRIERNLKYERNYESDIYLAKKDDLESYCLNFALKYQILTPFTSFICVLKQNNSVEEKTTEKVVIPPIQSIDYENTVGLNFLSKKSWHPMSSPSYTTGIGRGAVGFSSQYLAYNLPSMMPLYMQPNISGNAFMSKNSCGRPRPRMPSQENDNILMKKIKKKEKKEIRCLEKLKKRQNRELDYCSNRVFEKSAEMTEEFEEDEKKCHPLMRKIFDLQKDEGVWRLDEKTAGLLGREINRLSELILKFNGIVGLNIPNNVWMTVLIVYFCKTFYANEIFGFSSKLKKAEDFLSKNSQNAIFAEFSKTVFFGSAQKPQILSKNCKCGQPLVRCENINSYQGDSFICDICQATNKIAGGTFHCEGCKFDLCEECNNDSKIRCFDCEEGDLVWKKLKKADDWICNVCLRRGKERDGVYECEKCRKFKLCIGCKALR